MGRFFFGLHGFREDFLLDLGFISHRWTSERSAVLIFSISSLLEITCWVNDETENLIGSDRFLSVSLFNYRVNI